jgi:peptide/nickel transport system permease protein
MTGSRNPRRIVDLLLPGAGRLASGEVVHGVGRLLLATTWWWATVTMVREFEFGSLVGRWNQAQVGLALSGWLMIATLLWADSVAWARGRSVDGLLPRLADFRKQFRRNRNGMLGFFGVAWLTSVTVLAPLLAVTDPDQINVAPGLLPPGLHTVGATTRWLWMGTDAYGRDLFSRVLHGGQISLVIGFIAVSIAATIGATLGASAGYFGGRIDRAIMWLVDLLLALPSLVLLLAIVGLFKVSGVQSIFLIVTVLGLTSWMGVSRIVRSQVLSLARQDFIQAARALGFSHGRILFRHLLPNAMAPVIVYCSLAIGSVMLAEASLSFLGLGVPPPTATWGTLVNDGRESLQVAPWISTFPGLFIVLAVMSFNLLGDGLRDTLDPKLRGR